MIGTSILRVAALAVMGSGQSAAPAPDRTAPPPVSVGGASAQAAANADPGLTMVPARCFNAQRQEILLADVRIFQNRIVTFSLDGLTLRSEIRRGTVFVKYSDEPQWTVIVEPLAVANYNAADARIYHGTLAGRPIIVWEETVENRARRAGIIEYRGRGMFPLCDGLIRTPEDLQMLEERRRQGRNDR
jgi:hypothetical protein